MSRTLALSLSATWLAVASSAAAINVQKNPDGSFYTKILATGPTTQKYDIVFVGDGFRKSDQAVFNARVESAVAALEAMVPYSEQMCGFNIWRVNVISNESGVDHPKDNIFKNTELDCRYGNPAAPKPEAERCITSDTPQKCIDAAAFAPSADTVIVLVNDSEYGGCADPDKHLIFSSTELGFSHTLTHELGHVLGKLTDEYSCYICDGSDNSRTYADSEPHAANATKATTLATIKWANLIAGGTPLPTTVDSPPGVVGIWEGALSFAKGVYRSESTCHMKELESPFCVVCEGEVRKPLKFRCLDTSEFLTCDPPCGKFRWAFPPGCLSCSDFRLEDEITFIVEGPSEEYTLEVLNDRAQVIAQAVHTEQGLKVEFRARRSDQYYFELNGSGHEQKILTFRANLLRNGKQENLPGAVVR